MNKPRRHRINRATAELLLTGRPGWHTTTDPRLLGLLADAAAPPRHAELAGERAAVEAFRSHRHRPAPTLGRLHMMKVRLAKLFTVKLFAATAGLVGAGGAAFAASAGALPAPVQNAVHGAVGAPAAPTTGDARARSSVTPSASPSASPSAAVSADPVAKHGLRVPSGHSSAPSPSFAGLCKAWLAHPINQRGKAANSSAFTALVIAADGSDKVVAYCKALAVSSTGPSPTASANSATPPPASAPGKSGEKGRSGTKPEDHRGPAPR